MSKNISSPAKIPDRTLSLTISLTTPITLTATFTQSTPTIYLPITLKNDS